MTTSPIAASFMMMNLLIKGIQIYVYFYEFFYIYTHYCCEDKKLFICKKETHTLRQGFENPKLQFDNSPHSVNNLLRNQLIIFLKSFLFMMSDSAEEEILGTD